MRPRPRTRSHFGSQHVKHLPDRVRCSLLIITPEQIQKLIMRAVGIHVSKWFSTLHGQHVLGSKTNVHWPLCGPLKHERVMHSDPTGNLCCMYSTTIQRSTHAKLHQLTWKFKFLHENALCICIFRYDQISSTVLCTLLIGTPRSKLRF